jgi:hypothetical protein
MGERRIDIILGARDDASRVLKSAISDIQNSAYQQLNPFGQLLANANGMSGAPKMNAQIWEQNERNAAASVQQSLQQQESAQRQYYQAANQMEEEHHQTKMLHLDHYIKMALGGVGTMHAAAGAINLAAAAVAAFKGDWQEVTKLIESLPFGIGAVATAFGTLLEAATSFKARMQEIHEEADKFRQGMAISDQAQAMWWGAKKENNLAGLDGPAKERERDYLDYADKFNKIEEMRSKFREKAGKGHDESIFDEAQDELTKGMQARNAESFRKQQEAEDDKAAKAKKKADDEYKSQLWDVEREKILAYQSGDEQKFSMLELDRQKELDLAEGTAKDKELINQKYDLERVALQRQIDEKAAGDFLARSGRDPNQRNAAYESRFMVGAPGLSPEAALAAKQLQEQTVHTKILTDVSTYLRRISDAADEPDRIYQISLTQSN